MKKLHIIWAHPRIDSLTAQMVKVITEQAIEQGFTTSELDLYRANFNPVLPIEDEPDWSNPNKVYSTEVMQLADQITDKDIIVFVFPVWWYSFPAILKGYLDRVWNFGLAYGAEHKFSIQTIRWIALVGDVKHAFEKRGNDQHIVHLLDKSISSYGGVTDSKVEFLYDTLGSEVTDSGREQHYQRLFEQAKNVIKQLVA